MFTRADVDGDGALNSREMHYANFLAGHYVVQETTTLIFSLVDRNGDGLIQNAEVQQTIEDLRRSGGPGLPTAESLSNNFRHVDGDHDDALNRREVNGYVATMLHSH
mmetsp:Transcript_42702/g.123436  ORF Transcript_42702/g.123436 Transcript_42702/m.123436 type:complete len:107 (-) Transcript_42702:76-396(-)